MPLSCRAIMLLTALPPAPPTPITQILGANSTKWPCELMKVSFLDWVVEVASDLGFSVGKAHS